MRPPTGFSKSLDSESLQLYSLTFNTERRAQNIS